MNRLIFIDDETRPGALNMALDNQLAAGESFRGYFLVMRLYRWEKPTLSCGFHQRIEKRVDLLSCRQKGVAVVRRPTGGRELLHDGDLSFSICSRESKQGSSDWEFLQKASLIITGGLKEIGIEAQITPRNKKSMGISQGPCLAATSQFEITSNGRKIVPLAQRIYRDSTLVHGSIPLSKPTIDTAGLLKIGDPELIKKQIENQTTDIEQLTRGTFEISRLKSGLMRAYADIFKGETQSIKFGQDQILNALKTISDWEIES